MGTKTTRGTSFHNRHDYTNRRESFLFCSFKYRAYRSKALGVSAPSSPCHTSHCDLIAGEISGALSEISDDGKIRSSSKSCIGSPWVVGKNCPWMISFPPRLLLFLPTEKQQGVASSVVSIDVCTGGRNHFHPRDFYKRRVIDRNTF